MGSGAHSTTMIAPEIIYPITTAVLALGIAFAWFRYANRDKSKDQMTEEATRREYETGTRDDRDSSARPR